MQLYAFLFNFLLQFFAILFHCFASNVGKVYGLGACTAFMTVVTITAWYQDGHFESVHVNMLNSCKILVTDGCRLFQDHSPQIENDLQVPFV